MLRQGLLEHDGDWPWCDWLNLWMGDLFLFSLLASERRSLPHCWLQVPWPIIAARYVLANSKKTIVAIQNRCTHCIIRRAGKIHRGGAACVTKSWAGIVPEVEELPAVDIFEKHRAKSDTYLSTSPTAVAGAG